MAVASKPRGTVNPMDQKQSDTTVSGDTSSAGIGALRSIFDDPIITSSLMQLGSSEAISGYIPVDEMSARANAQPGLVGPSGVAPVRESNDYSNFVLDDDDVSGTSQILYQPVACLRCRIVLGLSSAAASQVTLCYPMLRH